MRPKHIFMLSILLYSAYAATPARALDSLSPTNRTDPESLTFCKKKKKKVAELYGAYLNRLAAHVATSLELLSYFTLSLLRRADHYKRTTTCL